MDRRHDEEGLLPNTYAKLQPRLESGVMCLMALADVERGDLNGSRFRCSRGRQGVGTPQLRLALNGVNLKVTTAISRWGPE